MAFLFHHAEHFSSVKFLVIAIVLVSSAITAAIRYVSVDAKNTAATGEQTISAAGEIETSSKSFISKATEDISLAAASSSASVVSSLNLRDSIAVYVMSKKTGPCKDYRNTLLPSAFGMRCKTASALWRGLWTKKIDVSGYSKLRIKARLEVNDYTDYFAEGGHQGVNRDNFVDLIALSSDPTSKLDSECNHVVAEDKWSECSINYNDPSTITHCGLPKYTSSKSCDMEIDVSGRDAVHLLFSTSDVWMADIEGMLSNVEVELTK